MWTHQPSSATRNRVTRLPTDQSNRSIRVPRGQR